MGSSAGGGKAATVGMKSEATDRIDGRLTKDHGRKRLLGNGKKAQVFLGTRSHASPGNRSGSAQFSAHWALLLTPEQKNGIGSRVGVKAAGLDERVDEGGGKSTLHLEVSSHVQ